MDELDLGGPAQPVPDMLSFASLSYEQAQVNLQQLVNKVKDKARKRNEARTRLQIIDSVLFDCLGWSRDECEVEELVNRGFADYILSVTRPLLVVEAKREGIAFELPPNRTTQTREITLGSLKRDNPSFTKAAEQVTNYVSVR